MPVIKKPNQHFDVLTWSGTGGGSGATRSITGLNFQPDFIWEKARTSGSGHQLLDSVRGVGQNKVLASNSTGDEPEAPNTESLYGWMSAINSDGFTITNGTSTFDNWNKSGDNYVGWTWKGGGAAVTNTAGSITSQVSANPTAGFSVVTYTGTGGTGTTTVGHGLNVSPSMVIIKRRNGTTDWASYHTGLTSTSYYLLLNSAAAQANYGSTFISPSSSTLTIAADSSLLNTNTGTYVAYCFAPVAGYSAFGSYTGNGSTDGPFVYLGFRPRFVMIKSTGSQDWVMLDSSINPINVAGNYLRPNSNGVENGGSSPSTSTNEDFLSNGIKFRNDASSSGYTNGNGVTYIYMAFAEAPFKYSSAR